MHACIHTYIRREIHTCIHKYIYIYIYIHTCPCIHIYIYIYTYIRHDRHICTDIYVCILHTLIYTSQVPMYTHNHKGCLHFWYQVAMYTQTVILQGPDSSKGAAGLFTFVCVWVCVCAHLCVCVCGCMHACMHACE